MAMADDNKNWALPENLQKQELDERAKIDGGDFAVGHCGAYYAYRTGIDQTLVKTHGITDDAYALEYVKNVSALVGSLGSSLKGNILDAGCGIGFVTNAFSKINQGGRAFGLDLSKDAIAAACEKYKDCTFTAQSADELQNFENDFFDIIHSREFYLFTRSDDAELHYRFLEAFISKLKPGGVVLLQMIIGPHGFCNTMNVLKDRLRGLGYSRMERKVLVPLRLFRKIGPLGYSPLIYQSIALAGFVFERLRPERVGYLYFLQKKSAA